MRYPLVLSHHWGMRAICPPGTAPDVCEQREAPRYCVRGEDGECEFRVPDDELDLPPRNENRYDPSLQRDVSHYHRYFSKAIVERLEECGNQVFLSDKPPFASYAVRARSLRNTVLEALEETGSDKVILIGMSQGVQDARWLVATQPDMPGKVAAVVGLVGEDQGAGAASYFFDTRAALLGTDWEDMSADFTWDSDRQTPDNVPDDNFEIAWDGLWQRADGGERVLVEGYDEADASEFDLDEAAIYRHAMASMAVLTHRYMRGSEPAGADAWLDAWPALRDFTGVGDAFSDFVKEESERDNGVRYFSYAAQVRRWDEDVWGGGFDRAPFDTMQERGEPNDGYASLASQRFDTRTGADGMPYENFVHVETLSGKEGGRGYHHMFFSGRNDALYAPATEDREGAPYGGSSADFFEQVLVNLKSEGL